MKLPSIQFLTQTNIKTTQRFPMVCLSALAATMLSIVMIEYDFYDTLLYVNYLLIFILSTVLFINVDLYKECFLQNQPKKTFILYSLAGLFLVGIYFSFPSAATNYNEHIPYIRYTIFAIIFHLGVAVIPFLKNHQTYEFWNYNKTLFLRIFTGFIYTHFITIGLSLALVAIDMLFNINIHGELYTEIYIVTFGLFHTLFFLSGIPENITENSSNTTPPKSLKILSQYILLPLLCIYLAILYSYTAKILISGIWPKGIVTSLIIGLAIISFFYVLFVYPYSKQKENSWMLLFNKILYIALGLLTFMLFTAIFMRVHSYGITIQRYTIICFGIWIIINCAYLTIKPNHIQFIPTSLALILLVCSFGPWSIFSVSERSQVNRLETILTNNHILINDKIQNEVKWFYNDQKEHKENEHLISSKDSEEIRSIVNYLDDYHGFEKIQPWFKNDLSNIIKTEKQRKNHYVNEAEVYLTAMGISLYSFDINPATNFSYNARKQNFINVKDYNYCFPSINIHNEQQTLTFDKEKIHFRIKNNQLVFQYQNTTKLVTLSQIHWELQKNKKLDKNNIPLEKLSFITNIGNTKIKLMIDTIQFDYSANKLNVSHLEGKLLIRK